MGQSTTTRSTINTPPVSMCFDIGIVTCGPNEALVISGMCQGGKPTFISGGRALVFPCIQTVQRIPLNTMTLEVHSPRVYPSQGVPISVIGTAQVKINGSSEQMLEFAAEQFGGKPPHEILRICLETMEGHQRAIMGNMTVEEIYRDRQTFSQKVFDVASVDLHNMGISVISYTLKDIRDEVGYLASLGQARTAQVKRDALIGEAEAKRDSGIEEARAEEQRMEAKLKNDTDIAMSKRDFELKKASYDTEVNTAKAEAEMAYALQAAKVQARIKEAEAFAIECRAKAESEQMSAKAAAFKEYREAAMVDMMLKVLPQVAAEVSGPISHANKITMVATGDGPIGAGKITGEVLDIMGSLPETVKKMTGVDITAKMITVQD